MCKRGVKRGMVGMFSIFIRGAVVPKEEKDRALEVLDGIVSITET